MGDKTATRRAATPGSRTGGEVFSPRLVARALEEAHHGPAWHGPSLRPLLNGCTADEASWRIAEGRNTIWELVLHAAYGKHILRTRLTGTRERFPRPLARYWWPAAPEPTTEGWTSDLALLDSLHRSLVDVIVNLPAAALMRRRAGKRHTLGDEAMGIAMHDTYHAGQVALLRKLWSER